eukprot:scaffold149226_cov23-Tisochrysis_lutea.AAC.2
MASKQGPHRGAASGGGWGRGGALLPTVESSCAANTPVMKAPSRTHMLHLHQFSHGKQLAKDSIRKPRKGMG